VDETRTEGTAYIALELDVAVECEVASQFSREGKLIALGLGRGAAWEICRCRDGHTTGFKSREPIGARLVRAHDSAAVKGGMAHGYSGALDWFAEAIGDLSEDDCPAVHHDVAGIAGLAAGYLDNVLHRRQELAMGCAQIINPRLQARDFDNPFGVG